MSEEQQVPAVQQQQRLMWQCRRGMLELDILLQGFVECCYKDLSAVEKLTFERLLTYSDQDLLEYFFKQTQADDKEIANLVIAIRNAVTP